MSVFHGYWNVLNKYLFKERMREREKEARGQGGRMRIAELCKPH